MNIICHFLERFTPDSVGKSKFCCTLNICKLNQAKRCYFKKQGKPVDEALAFSNPLPSVKSPRIPRKSKEISRKMTDKKIIGIPGFQSGIRIKPGSPPVF
jgi:hypothetical protein